MRKTYTKGNTDWYLNTFKTFEAGLNGQAETSVHNLRKQAMLTLEDLGFPTTKHEEWKYTNVSPIIENNFTLSQSYKPGMLKSQDIAKYHFDGLENSCFVFINGHFASDLSNISGLKDSVELKSLDTAISENNNHVMQLLTKYASPEDDSFISLNTAFMQDGAFIKVPDGVDISQPIHLLFLSIPGKNPQVNFPRNLFVIGQSSRIKIVETYAGIDDCIYFTNSVNEIVIGENAELERYKIQIESDQAYHVSALHVSQERDSRFIDHNISLGGSLVRNNIASEFKAQGGSCVLNGLYIGTHKQHIDNHTAIDHAKAHCESHELYKGILDEKARGVFNGKIYVRPDAQKTNAIQANNCILLSDTATIDTKPQLEIFADDVKCTHGATIGQLDEDAYFYMRSRGINKTMARNLLIHAFASEVLDKINIDPIRESIADLFIDKLHTVRPE
jgi:Fe-S cluster assembly protein SufD